MPAKQLFDELVKRGCDVRDVLDEFHVSGQKVEIRRDGKLYTAEAWPLDPVSDSTHWHSINPKPAKELFLELKRLGYGVESIMKAFWECDGTDEAAINFGDSNP